MWSASALLGLRCPSLWYWSLTPHAGQCVMPIACALASTRFLNCLCSRVLVLLITLPPLCSLCLCCVRWWRVAASARRAPPPSNTTLFLFSFSSLLFSFSPRFSSFVFWIGVCCVVRAQLCEHARNTTHTIVFCVVYLMVCVLLHTQCVCCPTTCCSLLTITVLNVEHCVPLITL